MSLYLEVLRGLVSINSVLLSHSISSVLLSLSITHLDSTSTYADGSIRQHKYPVSIRQLSLSISILSRHLRISIPSAYVSIRQNDNADERSEMQMRERRAITESLRTHIAVCLLKKNRVWADRGDQGVKLDALVSLSPKGEER